MKNVQNFKNPGLFDAKEKAGFLKYLGISERRPDEGVDSATGILADGTIPFPTFTPP